MNHTIYKMKWCKTYPDHVIEEVYSIHLSPDTAKVFAESQKEKPTYPGFVPQDHLEIGEVNDEVYQYLLNSNGIWQGASSAG